MSAITAPKVGLIRRRPSRGLLLAGVFVVWLILAAALRGRWTLPLGPQELNGLHSWLNGVRDAIADARDSNPIFVYGVDVIRSAIDWFIELLQNLIAQPAYGRPVPVIGWLGVVALVGLIAGAIGTIRTALLAVIGFTFLGLQGLWQESMDTLALTIAAVLLCLVIGIPIGVWAGVSDRVFAAITPVLDFLQTLPSFVYLSPITLFFLISPTSAAIVTVLYAVPPVIRYTAHGIRNVPTASVEAAESLGATRRQQLTGVLLPMSRRTTVLGINQTIMAALSMVTIAALINAPGLGQTVLKALTILDVGTAFNGGLAIVVLAIVLDRITTAAGRRAEIARHRSALAIKLRRPGLIVGAVVALVGVYLSRTYLWAADFPTTLGSNGLDINIGNDIAKGTSEATNWVQLNASGLTGGFKDGVTSLVIDPIQTLLTESPWFLVAAVVLILAWVLTEPRTTAIVAVCLALLLGTGLWQDSMATLAQTVVATFVVILLGVVIGVWMARNSRADAVIRPVLDAAQVMPAFVYLVPFLALFSSSRFTAIVAAVVYAAPVSIKVIADGVTAVPAATVEASTAAGSTAWQQIAKVQLPMARESLILAVNQGLCYVLSMVVVGGLVGAQALGYQVVAGFSNLSLYGKGLAAGIAIVLLGVMFNQITQAAANRARSS
jgi:glycine betaine/proline transport system permease protein